MIKFLILCILILFCCTSCGNKSTEEPVNMNELMKINAWLLDDELEGTGQWGYISEAEKTYPRYEDGDGYWIPDDGVTQVENEDVFEFEALELGVPRIMAPMTMYMTRSDGNHIGYSNLNLHIDFDGIIEVEKVEPQDDSIILKYSLNGPPIAEDNIQISAPCGINICPIGKEHWMGEKQNTVIQRDTLVGKEYIIRIRGCTLGGDPVVTAEVKLTAIPDPEYPWETVHDGRYNAVLTSGEERTRFCSVELVSYTFSEMYILRGEAGNIE